MLCCLAQPGCKGLMCMCVDGSAWSCSNVMCCALLITMDDLPLSGQRQRRSRLSGEGVPKRRERKTIKEKKVKNYLVLIEQCREGR